MRSSLGFGMNFISIFVLSFALGYYMGIYIVHFDKVKVWISAVTNSRDSGDGVLYINGDFSLYSAN